MNIFIDKERDSTISIWFSDKDSADIDEVNILRLTRVINENTYSYNARSMLYVRDTGIMNESRIKLPLFSNKNHTILRLRH